MIGCQEAIKRLWEYLDNTVDVDERVLVEDHLARCRTCCGELEFAKELRRMLGRPSADDLPTELLARLDRTIEGLGT